MALTKQQAEQQAVSAKSTKRKFVSFECACVRECSVVRPPSYHPHARARACVCIKKQTRHISWSLDQRQNILECECMLDKQTLLFLYFLVMKMDGIIGKYSARKNYFSLVNEKIVKK